MKMWFVITVFCLQQWTPSILGLKALYPTPPEFLNIETSILQLMMDQNRSYGFLGVVAENHLVYRQVFSDRSMRSNLFFRSRSLSHYLVALAVLKLSEDRKLVLNNRVFGFSGLLHKLLPWSTFESGKLDQGVYGITIEHLLMQTSGLECRVLNYSTGQTEDIRDQGKDENKGDHRRINFTNLLKLILSRPLVHPPGSNRCSGDEGYIILCFVIESISGQKCEDFIKVTLLNSVGMWQTCLGKECSELVDRREQSCIENSPRSRVSSMILSSPTREQTELYVFTFFQHWNYSVYDILRLFSSYFSHHIYRFFSSVSLKFLFEQPVEKISQHASRWATMGVRADNNGVSWIESDRSSDKDFVLGCKNTRGEKKWIQSGSKSTCWFFLLSGRKGYQLKKTLTALWERKITWPMNVVYPDLFDFILHDTYRDADLGVKFSVPITSKDSYVTAIGRSNYTVFRSNQYVFHGQQYFSYILGINVQYRQLVCKSNNSFTDTKLTNCSYKSSLNLTNIESKKNFKKLNINSFIKTKATCDIKVKRERLNYLITLFRKKGMYLASFTCSFSATELSVTFTTMQPCKWLLSYKLTWTEVEELAKLYEKRGFIISEMCGYEESQEKYFLVRWIKNIIE
ncbi:uncharacterized protein LOC143239588 [Tachypleus tridentatus]|uniref:uncharacterized protein LOC143239588 n=1 Tax=Tachypleus tridentatus TaxID=6853 RepID=UPI003FD256E3